jgi:arylformamidase
MLKKKYYDVTIPLADDIHRWPGSTNYKLNSEKRIDGGDICNESSVCMDLHYGTHVDAPLHFIREGKSSDILEINKVLGDAYVVDMRGADSITYDRLESADIPDDCKRLLIKTNNSILWRNKDAVFYEDYTALDLSACQWIVEKGIALVGIDYLSIESYNSDCSVHLHLLSNDVVILESLDLNEIKEGVYELICMPLKITGAEAAPARVILREYE